MIKSATVLIVFLSMTGCASQHKKLGLVEIGLYKIQALKKFGEPHEKYRTRGHDHWVYETERKAKDGSKNAVLYKHILVFSEGVVIDKLTERTFTTKELYEYRK